MHNADLAMIISSRDSSSSKLPLGRSHYFLASPHSIDVRVSASFKGLRGHAHLSLFKMNRITNDFSPYSPLDPALKQIRVLILHPGPASAELCCSLAYTSLAADDRRTYEAVSYCWGDVKAVETIKLDGRSFAITQSAGGALRAFREEAEDRCIWLDAICINQQDDEERGLQVSIMGDIYRAATRALVWLGDDDGTFGDAYTLMTALIRQMGDETGGWNGQAAYETLKDFEWDSRLHMKDIRTRGIPSYESPAWDALERFFSRPWFNRMWVIQEIVLSHRPVAFCGREQVDWVIIQMAASWITHQRYDARSHRPGLLQAKNVTMVWQFAAKSDLQSLLLLTRDFQATDPRDKVFGVLGMATDCRSAMPDELKPSYLKSTRRIFSDATKYTIRASQNLDVLSQIGYICSFEDSLRNSSSAFPSWVPRWDLGKATTFDASNTVFWGRLQSPFSASGSSVVERDTIHHDPDTLTLPGFRIDKIKRVSSIMDSQKLAQAGVVAKIWNDYASDLAAYPTGEQLLRAFSLTMVADSTLNKLPASLDSQHDSDFAAYISARGKGLNRLSKDDRSLLLSNIPKGDEVRYGSAASNGTNGRSFCTTEAGWMGVCPPTAKEGDLVCLLFGGKVLYTIRREHEHSKFIGECYIHGRMDGRGLEHQLRTFAPAEAFHLR